MNIFHRPIFHSIIRHNIPRKHKNSFNFFTIMASTTTANNSSALPSLPNTTRLSPRIIRILGQNPSRFTLQGTNTYLLGTGRDRILIDSGEGQASWFALLQATLASEHARIATVLLTHWHADHVGGLAALLRHNDDDLDAPPPPRIFKHPAVQLGGLPPGTPQPEPIADGQVFAVPGAAVKAVHTPGHTTDHMVFILHGEKGSEDSGEKERAALFTGDNVLGHGTAVFEDLSTYMASLERMASLVDGRGYPGHGDVIDDVTEKINGYLAHRRAREREVLKTLVQEFNKDQSGKGVESMSIVRVIYKDVSESLWPAANKGVVQILQKLVAEGKATYDDTEITWKPTEKAVL